ncbi:hypothetical protein ACN38_g12481, partial [Penicillium nordicum]
VRVGLCALWAGAEV